MLCLRGGPVRGQDRPRAPAKERAWRRAAGHSEAKDGMSDKGRPPGNLEAQGPGGCARRHQR
eukprot:1094161-Alexandrium_andersonii.AAC.1